MPSIKLLLKSVIAFTVLTFPFILLGIGLGSYPGYMAYEYVWKDARFCTSCHVHDYASIGFEGSSHKDRTTCHDCHHQRLRDYIREPFVLILENTKFPKDLKHTPNIPDQLCQACHLSSARDRSTITGPLTQKEVDEVPKIDHTKLHAVHLAKTTDRPSPSEIPLVEGMDNPHPQNHKLEKFRKIDCMDCHGGPTNRAHQLTATDTACLRCHAVHNNIVSEVGCRGCHSSDFIRIIDHQE